MGNDNNKNGEKSRKIRAFSFFFFFFYNFHFFFFFFLRGNEGTLDFNIEEETRVGRESSVVKPSYSLFTRSIILDR